MTPRLCCLVTEHEEVEGQDDWSASAPASSQISAVDPALMFVSCTEKTSHWQFQVVGTYEESRVGLGRVARSPSIPLCMVPRACLRRRGMRSASRYYSDSIPVGLFADVPRSLPDQVCIPTQDALMPPNPTPWSPSPRSLLTFLSNLGGMLAFTRTWAPAADREWKRQHFPGGRERVEHNVWATAALDPKQETALLARLAHHEPVLDPPFCWMSAAELAGAWDYARETGSVEWLEVQKDPAAAAFWHGWSAYLSALGAANARVLVLFPHGGSW